MCLRPAHSSAAVSKLGEGPGGLWPVGGDEGHLNPSFFHRAAGPRQRRGQICQDPQKLWEKQNLNSLNLQVVSKWLHICEIIIINSYNFLFLGYVKYSILIGQWQQSSL